MKKILVVSNCTSRGDTIGLVGGILNSLSKLSKREYSITLFDYNFYDALHDPKRYPVDNYLSIPFDMAHDIIRRIPRVRIWYANYLTKLYFNKILKKQHFDFIIFHQVPSGINGMLQEAHTCGAKVIFEPFGSDILRVSNKSRKALKDAFADVDAVVGRKMSNVLIAAETIYKVPHEKIFEQRECLKSVQQLKNVKGRLSREDMHKELGMPFSNYNIVCGYSARESHKHKLIIDALIQSKEVLPNNYQIIFPMTYGALMHHSSIEEYVSELKTLCDEAGLRSFFLTNFISKEQMAYLHLITDLFIEIQPTDNGNAFMIEALFARNQIVTGRWLNYKRFEQFGEPYYLIDTPVELSSMLKKIFTNKVRKIQVPQELVDFFDVPDGYDHSEFWNKLFNTL